MQIALSGRSALAALRAYRATGATLDALPACDLPVPSPAPLQRWSRPAVESALGAYRVAGELSVAVPEAKHRIRTKGVTSVVQGAGVPAGSYREVAEGIYIPCPELLFVEMGAVVGPTTQRLVGMELCGSYARPDAFRLPAATSAERIRAYLDKLGRLDGITQSRRVAARLLDNAWSPMEAIVALLVGDSFVDLGYGMGPLVLNARLAMGADGSATGAGAAAAGRIPDILFAGTHVGINYEGEGHLDLRGVVDATAEALLHPETATAQEGLDCKVSAVRDAYVGDQRRNRDLLAEGYTIFTVTKEDLYEEGAFDSVVLQCMTAIERETGRSLRMRRARVLNRLVARQRQLRIWSMLPGRVGADAREELRQQFDRARQNMVVFEEDIPF